MAVVLKITPELIGDECVGERLFALFAEGACAVRVCIDEAGQLELQPIGPEEYYDRREWVGELP